MRRLIHLLLAFLIIYGCKPGIPDDIIQPDEMALILNDIHLVDGYISNVTPDSSIIIASAYYNGVYKKFGIDSAKFQNSISYYHTNPAILDEIYKRVTDSLEKQKRKIIKDDSLSAVRREKKIKQQLKADSVKRADSLSRAKAKAMIDSIRKADIKKLNEAKNKPRAKTTVATKHKKIVSKRIDQ